MGSLVKCQGCGERCGQRPIGVYWRWMRADGVWKKYYQRICVACYAAKVLPLDVDYPSDVRLTCPACGIDTEGEYDGIYSTSFPAGAGQVDVDAPFCDVHAAELRVWIVDHARDTDAVEGAPEPPPQGERPVSSGSVILAGLGRSTGRQARRR